jgi:alkylation response protein AidB-like acyl-CoA dehydrogenase
MLALDPFLTAEDRAFRDSVREFLDQALTPELRQAGRYATSVFTDPAISLEWQRILHAKGWAAPDWPEAFGGTGWSPLQRYIFAFECAVANAPNLAPMGLKMIAPVLFRYGTAEQQRYYLRRILSGEDYWCQGFSEPGAGSDLAALKLRATGDGGDYVLDGSKIWTTHAHFANRMFALVRTSGEGRPQSGITFLMLDMDTAGISVQPIRNASGEHDFNQVFFDGVRVPKANRLGPENGGWDVAKYLLGFERGGRYAPALRAYLNLLEEAASAASAAGPAMQLTEEAAQIEALCAMEIKAISGHQDASQTAVQASMLKIVGTELSQRLDRLALQIAGPQAIISSQQQPDCLAALAARRFLNNRAASIYAGSNEIQRDIIARVLLPS